MDDKLKYTLQRLTMFVCLVVARNEGYRSWSMSKPRILFCALFWLIILVGISCKKEEVKPPIPIVRVMDYFPFRYGNKWTYTVEGLKEDGSISSTNVEKWQVNQNLFIDLYNVTPDGEDYSGYKAIYLHDDLEIDDIMGTFISVKYINLPADSLILVASDSVNILRDRWILGGLTKMETSFGESDCICTKTTYHFPNDKQDEYLYFCKSIGIFLMEKNYIREDTAGNSLVEFTWRRTLTELQIN